MWVTGTYDVDTNQTLWGVGNPMPMMDSRARPGDNLFTNSSVAFNAATGVISGTPTVVSSSAPYTVSASGPATQRLRHGHGHG